MKGKFSVGLAAEMIRSEVKLQLAEFKYINVFEKGVVDTL